MAWRVSPPGSGSDPLAVHLWTPVGPKTANYTAAAGELVRCDPTGGAFTVTLPNAPANGTRVAAKITTATAPNAVTIACAGSDAFNRASGPTTRALSVAGEAAVFEYDSTGHIWTVVGSDTPVGSLDSRYVGNLSQSLAGGRPVIASRLGNTAANLGLGTPFQTYLNKHTALVGCSDLRLVFSSPLSKELDQTYPTVVKVGLVTPAAVTVPVQFNGKQSIVIEPGGHAAISDPIPVELAAADVFWTRVFTSTPFGMYMTVDANMAIGVQSIPIRNTSTPTGQSGLASTQSNSLGKPGRSALNPIDGYLGTVLLDAGGSAETVTIVGYEWDAGNTRWNAILGAVTTKGHNSGANFGQFPFINAYGYADLGEGIVNSGNMGPAADVSWASSAIATYSTLLTTTLTNLTNIGDTTFQVPSPLWNGTTLTVDTAGNLETVTVKTIQGTASPYTVVLTAAMTKAHAAGVTVSSVAAGVNGNCLRPQAIVADRLIPGGASAPATVLLVGDSIPSGTGYSIRQERSYATLAFEGVRPYFMVSAAGEGGNQFAPLSGRPRRTKLFDLASWALLQYGVNDLYGSRTVAQLQASNLATATALANRGIKVVMQTLTPRTSSTDLWNTTGNQTIVSATPNTNRVTYNNWVRAGCPIDPTSKAAVAVGTGGALLAGAYGHPIRGYVEVADAVETTRDSGIWIADGNGPYTADGIHPTSLGHVVMAVPVTAAINAGALFA